MMAEDNTPKTDHAAYEETHVHQVYDQIASHFSQTRYKPWPVVDSFLRDLTPGAVGLDIGCGNGKYLGVRHDIFIIASDRSSELIRIASQHTAHDALVADTLSLPHGRAVFDFAICVAVVHHLSTTLRRREAIRSVLELLRTGNGTGTRGAGQALFFVWALEQKDSRRGWDAGGEQDVLVPWVLKQDVKKQRQQQHDVDDKEEDAKVYQRYYHLYKKGELEEDIEQAGGKVVRNGYDRDNWWAVAERMS